MDKIINTAKQFIVNPKNGKFWAQNPTLKLKNSQEKRAFRLQKALRKYQLVVLMQLRYGMFQNTQKIQKTNFQNFEELLNPTDLFLLLYPISNLMMQNIIKNFGQLMMCQDTFGISLRTQLRSSLQKKICNSSISTQCFLIVFM